MFTRRRTKLAIAAAILIVGTGTAFLFRREDASDAPLVAKNPAGAADLAAKSAKSVKGTRSPAPPATEPALAGRIEPYGDGWSNPPAATAGTTVSDRAESKMPGSRTTAGSAAAPLAERPPDPAPRERPASYPSAATSSTAASATRPPAYGMPATANPPAALERPSTVFERFADHGPSRIAAAADHRHKIVDGDTLASIARRHLGAEDRFLDLFEHNRDVLVTPELLPIGKELRIPPPDYVRPRDPPIESNSSGLTAVSAPQSRVVQAGSRPAVQTPQSPNASPFADGSRLLQGSVPDGSPGRQVLQTTESPSASGGLPPQTYVVQAHDTLGLIARKVYGDINRQSELIDANRQQLRSPRDLRPGMKLVVPGGRKP